MVGLYTVVVQGSLEYHNASKASHKTITRSRYSLDCATSFTALLEFRMIHNLMLKYLHYIVLYNI